MGFDSIYSDLITGEGSGGAFELINRLPVACCAFDRLGNLLDCNEKWWQLFDFDIHQISPESFMEILPSHQPCSTRTADFLIRSIRDAIEEGSTLFALHYVRPNGEVVNLKMELGHEAGFAVGCAVVADDGARAWGEGVDNKWEHFFENAAIPCSLWNDEHTIISCNAAMREMLGVADVKELVENFSNFSPVRQPDGSQSVDKVTAYLKQAFAEGEITFKWVHINRSGESIPCVITLKRIAFNGQNVIGSFIQDLRPLLELGVRLAEAEARAQTMMDTTPMAVTLYDKDIRPVYCNQEALSMFGATTKEKYLSDFEEMLLAADAEPGGPIAAIKNHVRQTLEEGYVRTELAGIRFDGSPITADATWVRIEYQSGYAVVEYMRDLTEVKTALEREKEASQVAKLVADASPMLVEFFDEYKNITYCNPRAKELLELDSHEEYLRRFEAFAPEFQPCGTKTREKGLALLQQALDDGYVRSPWLRRTATGQLLPMEVILVRTVRNGRPMIISYSVDMRLAEAAIKREKEAGELAHLYLDSSPLFIEVWDDKLNIIDCSQQTLDFFKVKTKEEFIEKYYSFMPPVQACGTPSKDIIINAVKKALATGKSRYEFTHISAQGEPLPIEAILARIEHLGKYTVLAYNHDLRPVKKAMEEMSEADKRAQLMLDSTPLSCYLIKDVRALDGRISSFAAIDCNRAAVDLFGLKNKEEALAKFWQLFPEYTTNGEAGMAEISGVAAAAMESGSLKFEHNMQTINGEPVPCELTMVRLSYKGEPVLACYVMDLRQIKAMVEEMKRIDVAEEESRAKTRFLARMSHEIRTPLNAIIGITEIEMQKGTHSAETEEALYRIYSSSDMLHTIINDILDLSKVEAGKMEIVPVRYELASFLVDTVQLNIMYIGSKQIRFHLAVDEKLPTYFIGDELRIKQILNNLLSNAFKYTNEGSVTLAVTMEETGKDEVDLIFKVKDSGQGMSAAQLKKLFDFEFIRFNISKNRTIEGTGLGMNITYQLLDMMKGDINVESEVGEGTTFTVRIPQKPASDILIGKELANSLAAFDSSQTAYKRRFSAARTHLPDGSVLVVDDVESNLYVAKGLLLPYKLKVETVTSGFEAIDKIKEGNVYDIVFMDHMMPDLDGVETTRILREMGYMKPIVALTANALKGQEDLFISSGFSGFVSKPINVNQLDAYLMRFIRDKNGRNMSLKAAGIEEAPTAFIEPPEPVDDAQAVVSDSPKKLPKGLIDSFLRDTAQALGFLEGFVKKPADALDEATVKLFVNHVHGMKSALANVGKRELSQLAGELEDASRGGNIESILEDTPKFISGLQEIAREFDEATTEAPDTPDEDPVFLREQLLAISQACEIYNKKTAKGILDALGAKPCSKATKAVLSEITVLLLQGDFEEAAAAAKQAAESFV